MKISVKALLAASAVIALPGMALANQELLKLQADPNQWAQQSGNYSGWRCSFVAAVLRDPVIVVG